MKILFLGVNGCHQKEIIKFLIDDGNIVDYFDKKINKKDNDFSRYKFLISFGYRYILSKEIIDLFGSNAINLHISLLPWNRGADPNLWSFIDNTPKGVTIHKISEGIDTGDIICQKTIEFSDNDTLLTSYEKLQQMIVQLFKSKWDVIKKNNYKLTKQVTNGTFHQTKDGIKYKKLLPLGWNTKVKDLESIINND